MSAYIMPILDNESAQLPKSSWTFCRMQRKIRFTDSLSDHYCDVDMSVQILADGSFMLSYENTYETKKPTYDMRIVHPLFYKSKNEQDDSILDGLIVSANMITFHMINCLMTTEDESENYNTGCRPFTQYCGEIMRALVELEF